ncbi:MAG: sigma-54 dependent transcriptional regulator [Gammaproteobacteria bacterium]|nr:sigma-54 dependent transcriptional regulator [Gammaproteobacteria bacterium]
MTGQTILVVDDEPDIRQVVSELLEDEEYAVVSAENADTACQVVAEQRVDLVLLDIWMPGTDGISLLKDWAQGNGPDAPIIMISGHGNVETAVEAIRYGAYDFLEKPLSTAKLLVTVQRALQSDQLRKENLRLRRRLEPASELVGKSKVMQELRDQVQRVAQTDSWVLVTGEPGSGKGVVARSLHNQSPRSKGRFVEVSLAAVPAQSIAPQLFGSEIDGVIRPGRFEEAKGGTLFLDEVADMDLETQAKLLSALQDSRFLRVGGQHYVEADVRIVAATNQDLRQAVEEGQFREDLFYRLNVVPIHVAPLREHVEDVPELVEFYLNWSAEREQLPYRKFSTAALNALRSYSWPGNVRELKNLVQRLLILNRGEEVTGREVELAFGGRQSAAPFEFPESAFEMTLREARDRFEKSYLEFHLMRVGGNVSELAQMVGMERTHLYRKLKGFGIDPKAVKTS